MNTLPEDIQDTIYKYKHQIEFKNVINEIRTFKRNRMRAFPLLCYKCYRNKELCEECVYNFEIKMECRTEVTTNLFCVPSSFVIS